LLGLDRATGRQVAPEVVDFFLILAVDLKRNRLAELEQRPAIETGEGLAVEFEADGHHRAFRLAVKFLADLAVVRPVIFE
jgi:hypothetical protein